MVSTKHFTPRADMLRPTKKLRPLFAGPYTITEVINPVAYRLDLPTNLQVHPVFHVSPLKRFVENPTQFSSRTEPPPPEIQADGTEEFELEAITDKRVLGRGRWKRIEYLLKWKGYPASESSWEPVQNLDHAREAIQDYETGS